MLNEGKESAKLLRLSNEARWKLIVGSMLVSKFLKKLFVMYVPFQYLSDGSLLIAECGEKFVRSIE